MWTAYKSGTGGEEPDRDLEQHMAHKPQSKKNADAWFEAALKELVSDPNGPRCVMLRGSTPGFNDGDPCRHSMDVRIDGWEGGYIEPYRGGIDDWCVVPSGATSANATSYHCDADQSEDEDSDLPKAVFPESGMDSAFTVTDVAPSSELFEQFEALEGVIESVWGTDWCAVAWRDDQGEVHLQKGFYNCGY